MSEFYSCRDVKASRKPRTCDECGHPINVGDPYRYQAVKDEGEFYTLEVHAECQAWASRVMCSDDGRGFLRDSDPSDEYELAEDVAANPPSALVYSRLPPIWRAAVDEILGPAAVRSGATITGPDDATRSAPARSGGIDHA